MKDKVNSVGIFMENIYKNKVHSNKRKPQKLMLQIQFFLGKKHWAKINEN